MATARCTVTVSLGSSKREYVLGIDDAAEQFGLCGNDCSTGGPLCPCICDLCRDPTCKCDCGHEECDSEEEEKEEEEEEEEEATLFSVSDEEAAKALVDLKKEDDDVGSSKKGRQLELIFDDSGDERKRKFLEVAAAAAEESECECVRSSHVDGRASDSEGCDCACHDEDYYETLNVHNRVAAAGKKLCKKH